MLVSKIDLVKLNNLQINNRNNIQTKNLQSSPLNQQEGTKLPLGFNTSYNIAFGMANDPNRVVMDMEYDAYKECSEYTKKRYRKVYNKFETSRAINKTQLEDPTNKGMPLKSERTMNDFLDIAKIYVQHKDQPIICLGRSPKWFLNAALWMKDGLEDYKYVAFSGHWMRDHEIEGAIPIKRLMPTEEQEKAYRLYLNEIGASPADIVKHWKETGKKSIITDYIYSGKGACSFLDVMGRYAKDQGVLEDFSKSIEILGIGCMEYMYEMHPGVEYIPDPKVPMPPVLQPYEDNIRQRFYDMDYVMFKEMLINKNSNECRSTYYPCEAWTVYRPNKVKVGKTSMAKIKEKLNEMAIDKTTEDKVLISYTAAMQDFRNLLNFRILDSLDIRGLLKKAHVTR